MNGRADETRRRLAAAALIITSVLAATPAPAIVGDSDEYFGLDGSLRLITAVTDNYDAPLLFGPNNAADGLAQANLRLTAGGRPTEWFSYEVHGLHLATISAFAPTPGGSAGGTSLFGSSVGLLPYRLHPLQFGYGESGGTDIDARIMLDRFALQFVTPIADIIVGRQAITFGKAYFWNPLDVFLAFGSTQFDRDYKPGVDALRVDFPIGDFSGVTLVGGMGDTREDDLYFGTAILARAFTTFWDWDFALQGGKIHGGYQLGGAAVGELYTIELRAEGAYFWALDDEPLDSNFSGVLGIGRRFENTLSLQLEHYFNGGGKKNLLKGFALAGAGRLLQAGRHVTGIVASYEIFPILFGQFAYLFEWQDYSMLFQPGLVYSAANEVDIIAGAILAVGKRPLAFIPRSEFGTYPHFFYLEAKVYF